MKNFDITPYIPYLVVGFIAFIVLVMILRRILVNVGAREIAIKERRYLGANPRGSTMRINTGRWAPSSRSTTSWPARASSRPWRGTPRRRRSALRRLRVRNRAECDGKAAPADIGPLLPRQAARLHRPPSGPLTLTVNPQSP